MNSQPYDLIAEAYCKTDFSPTKEFVAKPTFLSLLGNTNDKKVIDVGCGSGYSTRLVRGAGPCAVVGVDISAQQIRIAQEIEQKSPLGIVYHQCDIASDSFLLFQNFDLATALYLLHYASTKDELYAICNQISGVLRPGGSLVAINSNPDHPVLKNKKYGITTEIFSSIHDGATRTVTYFESEVAICSFKTYFWRKDIYVRALSSAGFEDIRWHTPVVSDEGIQLFGEKFWGELLGSPFICGITCTKKK